MRRVKGVRGLTAARAFALAFVVAGGLAAGCEAVEGDRADAEAADVPAAREGDAGDAAGPDGQSPGDGVTPDGSNGSRATGRVALSPVQDGYVAGGLLARYWLGGGASAAEVAAPESAELALMRLEESVHVSKDDLAVAALMAEGVFTVRYEGAFRIEEAGTYRLAVVASDSVEVVVAGEVVLSFWALGQEGVQAVELALEPGWYPLEVTYVRDPYRARLDLFLGPVDGAPQRVGGVMAGYADPPPATVGALEGEVVGVTVRPWSVRVGAHASVAARLEVTATVAGEGPQTVSSAMATLRPSVSVDVEPDSDVTLSAKLIDLWGRELSLPVDPVVTPAEPPYVTGGLLGTYHSGTKLDTPLYQRWDPVIDFPAAADGVLNGSFATQLPVNQYSVRWEGGLWIEESGTYLLHLGTDDGQRLFVDGELVAELWSGHALTFVSATLELERGWLPVTLEMYESKGDSGAKFEWEGPGISRQIVPADMLGVLLPEPEGGTVTLSQIDIGFTGGGEDLTLGFGADRLSKAVVTVTPSDGEPVVKAFDSPSTTFAWRFDALPEGLVVVRVDVTALDGSEASSGNLGHNVVHD